MAARFTARSDDEVDTRRGLARHVHGADRAATATPCAAARASSAAARQRIGDERWDGRPLPSPAAPTVQVAAEVQTAPTQVFQAVRRDRDGQHLRRERLCRGNGRQQPLGIEGLVLAEDLVRDEEIDAVGFTVDVRVDPGEFLLQALGGHAGRAEHPHPAGPRYRRDDIAAMAESEEREVEPETVTQYGFHGRLPQRPW